MFLVALSAASWAALGISAVGVGVLATAYYRKYGMDEAAGDDAAPTKKRKYTKRKVVAKA